jgi:hypothetical protein
MQKILIILAAVLSLGAGTLGYLNREKLLRERDAKTAALTECDGAKKALTTTAAELKSTKEKMALTTADSEKTAAAIVDLRARIEKSDSLLTDVQKQVADKDAALAQQKCEIGAVLGLQLAIAFGIDEVIIPVWQAEATDARERRIGKRVIRINADLERDRRGEARRGEQCCKVPPCRCSANPVEIEFGRGEAGSIDRGLIQKRTVAVGDTLAARTGSLRRRRKTFHDLLDGLFGLENEAQCIATEWILRRGYFGTIPFTVHIGKEVVARFYRSIDIGRVDAPAAKRLDTVAIDHGGSRVGISQSRRSAEREQGNGGEGSGQSLCHGYWLSDWQNPVKTRPTFPLHWSRRP